MMKLPSSAFALVALALLISPAVQTLAAPKSQAPAAARYPEARCEQVRQSVLSDLPHFCSSDISDKVRLIDFGNQIELLEKHCGQAELAAKLKRALGERVHRKNRSACTTLAEEMVRIVPSKARASAPEAGF